MKTIVVLYLTFLFCIPATRGQTLSDYIELALANNAGLLLDKFDYNITEAGARATSTWEATEFGIGYLSLLPKTVQPAGALTFSAGQRIPWPGTFRTERALAQKKVKLAAAVYDLKKLELAREVKQLYYRIYARIAISQIYKDNKDILENYEEIATRAMENNHVSLPDVLLIQSKKNELHNKAFQSFNLQRALIHKFNTLLNRPPETDVAIPDALSILDVMIPEKHVSEHPLLQQASEKARLTESGYDLLKLRKRRPEFHFQVNAGWGKNLWSSASGAGLQAWIYPTAGILYPILGRNYKAEKEQLDLQKKRAEAEKYRYQQDLDSDLEYETILLQNAITSVVAAQKNAAVLQRIIDTRLKDIEHTRLKLNDILQLQLEWMKYRILEVEGTRDTYLHKANIEYLEGKIQ